MNMVAKNKTKFIHIICVALVMILTFFLSFYHCSNNGYSNLYYSASIRSMSESWHNFFYVSFDPAGFVSVDKPPFALWAETVLVKLFGFHCWSILLPSALAAAGSVYVLFRIVQKSFGFAAGLTSAAILAVTPIFTATARSDIPDTIFVLVLLLAAWSATAAAKTGSVRYFVITAALIGIGFNTKFLVAYLILPACMLTCLSSKAMPLRKKITAAVLSALVLTVVSFVWVEAVDLTPASERPYVSNSVKNSEMDLAFEYNGIDRISKEFKSDPPGLTRMFRVHDGEQISWFLAAAIAGIVASALYLYGIDRKKRQMKTSVLLLWFCWTAITVLFFSFYGDLTHRYYLNVIAPGISALSGIGLSCSVKMALQKKNAYSMFLFPICILTSVLLQLLFISKYFAWIRLFAPFEIICAFLALFFCLILSFGMIKPILIKAVAGVSIACLLVTPSIWSLTAVVGKVVASDPFAGPSLLGDRFISASPSFSEFFVLLQESSNHSEVTESGTELETYLEAHRNGAKYLVSTLNVSDAQDIIIQTGDPVLAVGGYNGDDQILTLKQFQSLVSKGEIQYFWVSDTQTAMKNKVNTEIWEWIKENGTAVSRQKYLSHSSAQFDGTLYYLVK